MKWAYLDNSATTAVCRAAADKAYEMMTACWGNPSSLHTAGFEAEREMEAARSAVAGLLGAAPDTLTFTSGGTEANNLAIFGAAAAKARGGRHIVTTAMEHPSVAAACGQLEKEGWEVTRLVPDGSGCAPLSALEAALRPDTMLVSMMLVNNETGAILPVEEAAPLVRRLAPRALLHCDAVQAFGKLPIRVRPMDVDLLTVSGHKIHAPKGVGALYLSDRLVQAFQPPYLGGEQERGLRPGTENLPYALGLAAAATRLAGSIKSRDKAVRALNDRLREGLSVFPEVEINSPAGAVPEVLNFSENCIKSETMLAWLSEKQIYVSSASACGRGQPSHTLAAMGRDPLAIDTAIRVSFCADNTPEDVDAFLERFEDGMKHLQRIKK